MTEADVLRALRDVNVQHILSFLVVAEVGGFRSAAEQLHISQSALSVQVRQLEAALQVQLLHRTTRSVSLTPQGRAAQIALGRVCGDLRRVVAELRDEAALQRGLLAIVALPSMAATILPKLVRNFAAKHPGIEVRLRDADLQSALAMIRRGEVDLGIMSRPPPPTPCTSRRYSWTSTSSSRPEKAGALPASASRWRVSGAGRWC
ncbi:LysR family transcriptional regulator [Pseudoroseomonas wenyumeiae]